jgi:hypothetical protein
VFLTTTHHSTTTPHPTHTSTKHTVMSNVSQTGKSLKNLVRRLTFRQPDQSNKCRLCGISCDRVTDSRATLLPCGHGRVHYDCFRDLYLAAQEQPVYCPECPPDAPVVVERVKTRATGGGNELEFDVTELEKREVSRPATD